VGGTMIKIQKSQTADTRTCDFTKVSKETLLESSHQHIRDVREGFIYFGELIGMAASKHDWTKISGIDQFHVDFTTGFKTQDWYTMHKKEERHHIGVPEGVRDDVNIVDLLEHIIDCVMAGKGRSGAVFPIELPNELLQKIVKNTVDLLASNIEVEDAR
jgi:hypothetical protein